MNTPNNTNKQLNLPELNIKIKSSNNTNFKLLKKIKKNLDKEFDLVKFDQTNTNQANFNYPKMKNQKSFKIFPEITFDCSTPVLKPNSPTYLKFSSPKKNFNIPRLKLSQRKLNSLKIRLFDEDDYEQNYPITPRVDYKCFNIPNTPTKKSINKQDLFIDNIDDYIFEDTEDTDDFDNFDNLENVKRQLIF